MGGPWRDRRFDPTAWRTPLPRVEAGLEAAARSGADRLTGIVIGYIASVVTSAGLTLLFLKNGW
jgi:hypothetical protein